MFSRIIFFGRIRKEETKLSSIEVCLVKICRILFSSIEVCGLGLIQPQKLAHRLRLPPTYIFFLGIISN